MKIRTRLLKAAIPIFLSFVFLAPLCQLDVPIKEMTQAKSAISAAIEVKAERYAPEDLKRAQELLYKSQDLATSKEVKEARRQAVEAHKAALAAIEKSLPLLARDSLEEAKKTYGEAEKLYAERFAPDEFTQAGAAIGEASELLSNAGYLDSHRKSLEALRLAQSAKEKSMAGAAQLKGEMDRIRTEAERLRENRGEEFAPEEMAKIKTSLAEAAGLIETNSIKDAIGRITDADNALKAASEKTYQRIAAERLEAAENGLVKANESPTKDQFADDIRKAAGLVEEGRALYASKSYMASAEKSNEAIALLNTIRISIEKKSEETRISEGETKTEDREKLSAEGKELEAGTEAPREYVVRYNPKRRDCLWRISLLLYKDARLWPLIYIANRDKIKDPDLIFPGQRFVIPPIPKKLPPEKEAGKTEEKPDAAKEELKSPGETVKDEGADKPKDDAVKERDEKDATSAQ